MVVTRRLFYRGHAVRKAAIAEYWHILLVWHNVIRSWPSTLTFNHEPDKKLSDVFDSSEKRRVNLSIVAG
jgi:hypothetical protein